MTDIVYAVNRDGVVVTVRVDPQSIKEIERVVYTGTAIIGISALAAVLAVKLL